MLGLLLYDSMRMVNAKIITQSTYHLLLGIYDTHRDQHIMISFTDRGKKSEGRK
jgi:hypothetical protein